MSREFYRLIKEGHTIRVLLTYHLIFNPVITVPLDSSVYAFSMEVETF